MVNGLSGSYTSSTATDRSDLGDRVLDGTTTYSAQGYRALNGPPRVDVQHRGPAGPFATCGHLPVVVDRRRAFRDGVVKYTGSGNDRYPLLSSIGSFTPTNTVIGYRQEDVSMDGTTKYTGYGNDRDRILLTVGSLVPTNTRTQQLP